MGYKKYARKIKKWVSKNDDIREAIKKEMEEKRKFLEVRLAALIRDGALVSDKLAQEISKGIMDEIMDFIKSI